MLVIPSDEALGAEKPGEPAARTISIFRHSFLTRGWPIWARYAITALIVLATLGFALLLPQNIPGAPFLPFVLAIIICSALFDHGSGIAAVLLSAGLAKWYLIPPTGTLDIARTDDIAGFSLFLAIGLVTAAIIEALHRVARDLIKANKRLVASEGDKDLLLQEASHRFKNELTMLTALLRLQSRHLEDQAARAALGSTADRVQILGRVHERLRRVNQTAAVDTREFITSLCEDLKVALVGLRPNHLLGTLIRSALCADSTFPVRREALTPAETPAPSRGSARGRRPSSRALSRTGRDAPAPRRSQRSPCAPLGRSP
jgi:signal transduction histidine kinase